MRHGRQRTRVLASLRGHRGGQRSGGRVPRGFPQDAGGSSCARFGRGLGMMRARVLLVDNYDSFTYNVVHLFGESGAEVDVLRNDDPRLTGETLRGYDGVIVGPGPGRPADAGRTMRVIEAAAA